MKDTALCRLAVEEDTDTIKTLWENCFDDTPQFVDWYFHDYYCPENTLTIEQGGQVVASAQMIPYLLLLRQQLFSASYIVGVDTAPEARNQGYAKELLRQCLVEMRQRRRPMALLMPFEGRFYYRYGFTFCYFQKQYELTPAELSCAGGAYGVVEQVEARERISVLKAIYDRFTRQFASTVVRTEAHWRHLIADGEMEAVQCFILTHLEQPEGYLLCNWQGDLLTVREMGYCHEQARLGLLAFLQQQPASQLRLSLPANDPLIFRLCKTKEAVRQVPFLMARIVDVCACLQELHYSIEKGMFIMGVEDSFLPWNDGLYMVQLRNWRAYVTKVKHQSPDFLISVEGLAQLFTGVLSVSALEQQQILQINNTAIRPVLQQLWPVGDGYINEYY